MKQLLLALSLTSAFVLLLADVNRRNGIAITTASTINGKTPNSHINGLAITSASNLPAPVLWLIGDDITVSDGVNVTNWLDSSGNGHTATAITNLYGVFKTGVLNGHDVVRFSGANGETLQTAAFAAGGATTNTTAMAVFVRRSLSSTSEGDFTISDATTLPYLASATIPAGHTTYGFYAGIANSAGVSQSTNVPYAALVRSDGAAYYNSDSQGPITPDYSVFTPGDTTVAVPGWFGAVYLPTQIDMAEVLVWDVQLTNQQMVWALAYATNKYGL